MNIGNKYIIKQILNLFIKKGKFDSVSAYYNYLLVEHVWTRSGDGVHSLKSPSAATFKQWCEEDGKNVNSNSIKFLLYWINREMKIYYLTCDCSIDDAFGAFCIELIEQIKMGEYNNQLIANIKYLLLNGEYDIRIEELAIAFSKYDLSKTDLYKICEFNEHRAFVVESPIENKAVYQKIELEEEPWNRKTHLVDYSSKADNLEIEHEKLREAKEAMTREIELEMQKNDNAKRFFGNRSVIKVVLFSFLIIGIGYMIFNSTKPSNSYKTMPQGATLIAKKNEPVATRTTEYQKYVPTVTSTDTMASTETEPMKRSPNIPLPTVTQKSVQIERKIITIPTQSPRLDKTSSNSNKLLNKKPINNPIKQIPKDKGDKEKAKKIQPSVEIDGKKIIKVGSYVLFGKYHGKPILWKCVNKGDGTMLVSEYIIRNSVFDAAESGSFSNKGGDFSKNTDIQKLGSNTWANSNIREWLNSDEESVSYSTQAPNLEAVNNTIDLKFIEESGFLQNFSERERTQIKKIGHNGVSDYVYLLSVDEVKKYIGNTNKKRIRTHKNGAVDSYWTRTPCAEEKYEVNYVGDPGYIFCVSAGTYWPGLLPALNLKTDAYKSGKGTKINPFIVF